ncbi:hypothetical protein HMPREF9520_02745 [Enterococcus faecalis TX1467]|nr:hypothetical protein HMPREF9520_02745 [Enterococcus faecalis TX1467]
MEEFRNTMWCTMVTQHCITGLFYAFFVVFTENVRITSAEEGHL